MDYEITYSPHRIQCSAVSTSPVTIRYQFMPLYGPQEWFDYDPYTLEYWPSAAPSRSTDADKT